VAKELSGSTASPENSGASCLGAIDRATAKRAKSRPRYFMFIDYKNAIRKISTIYD
jgi:hypothetical protein